MNINDKKKMIDIIEATFIWLDFNQIKYFSFLSFFIYFF
jgi:hypothetical protein